MKSLLCVYIHLGNSLYKYGLNQSINDNKVMKLYLTLCWRVRRMWQIPLLYFQRGVVKRFVFTLF